MRKLKYAAWTAAAVAVTALCLRAMLTADMVHTLGEVFPRVDPLVLALVLPLTVALNLVRSARFSLALGTRGPGSTGRMFHICALLVFLNFMLPFKTGEISFPVLVKRGFDTSYATSVGVLVYTRVMDLLMVVALGGFVLTAAWHSQASTLDRFSLPAALGASIVLLLLPIIVVRTHALGQRLTRHGRVLALMDKLFEGCRTLATPRRHAAYLGLTLAIWALLAACGFVTMRAMGAHNPPLDAILATTAQSITFALPVNGVAGVGPMQASWAYALTLVGWQWELAVANGFLYHATMVACSAILSLASTLLRIAPKREETRPVEADRG